MTPETSRAPDHRAAAELARTAVRRLSSEHVGPEVSVGRTTASEIRAPAPIPHYDSSAMDGFVVAGEGPWRLDPVTQEIPGARREAHQESGLRPLAPGTARPVLTGGLIPPGADGVLREEFVDVQAGLLRLDAPDPAAARRELTHGRHIRRAGCETEAGELMVPRGAALSPAQTAYLTVAGVDLVEVTLVPRVTVLTTGDEVVPSGTPGPGQVRDSFTPVMPAVLRGLGADPIAVLAVADERTAMDSALSAATVESDLIITTGGTGRSEADWVRRLLSARGAPVFDEIAMRPGHPTMASVLTSGQGRSVPVAALPGNPLAAMVALRVVVRPMIDAMLGRRAADTAAVRLRGAVTPARTDRLTPGIRGGDGTWTLAAGSGANMLRGLAAANGLLVLPRAGVDPGPDGTVEVEVLDLPW